MRAKTAVSVVVLGVALAAATPASARSHDCVVPVGNKCVLDAGPVGRKCGFTSIVDVTREAGWQTGDVNAGPLYTGAAGTLHCRIILNSNSHGAPAAAHASVRAVGGVVVMAQQLSYQATAADTIALCTSWIPDIGTPLYWTSETPGLSNPLGTGQWATEPYSECARHPYPEPNEPECGIWLAVDQRLGTGLAELWQDCEGHEPII